MEASPSGALTRLLQAAGEGDAAAFDRVFAAVYDELRRLAHVVRRGRGPTTLNTTALVHEAYVRLAGAERLDVKNRLHFMRIAARAMRFVLINAAERRMAAKRGGGRALVTFDDDVAAGAVDAAQVLALGQALRRLEALDPRQAQIVDCRYFAALTIEETAEVLGVSATTVNRAWRLARAWLFRELEGP